jgi:hypothetical protein
MRFILSQYMVQNLGLNFCVAWYLVLDRNEAGHS